MLWKYDVTMISTHIGKEEVCSNVYSGLVGLTRSGHCYTPEELEKGRKEISKGTCIQRILYILWLRPPFLNDFRILKSKVGLGPDQKEIDLRKVFMKNITYFWNK